MQLSDRDRETLRRCLLVVVSGELFDDAELHALFGLERAELRAVLDSWPNVNVASETVDLAINNSIANLLGYPHGRDVSTLVGVTEDELRAVLLRWREVNAST